MVRIALRGVGPVVRVETKEKLEIPHAVGLGAVHISQEKVSEFHGIEAGKDQSEVGVSPPLTTSMVQDWTRKEEYNHRQCD